MTHTYDDILKERTEFLIMLIEKKRKEEAKKRPSNVNTAFIGSSFHLKSLKVELCYQFIFMLADE